MQRISSKMTFYYKRVMPLLWFGFLVLFIALPTVPSLLKGELPTLPLSFLLGPAFICVLGYFMLKKFVFDMVDEVFDAGDALIVRNGDREERIALADITNVGYSPMVNPPRVTLSLRYPGTFGDRVTFCAPVSFIPFKGNPIVDELIQRIDAARRGGRR